MSLLVVWTQNARHELGEIIRYIAERNPVAARALKSAIEEGPKAAAASPYLYRSGRVAGTREIVVHPNYVIVFRVTDCIEVTNVLHSRRSFPAE